MTSFNLAFDSAVVHNELSRSNLVGDLSFWDAAALCGLDTMHPDICLWVTEMSGQAPSRYCSLKTALRTLAPQHRQLLDRHHDAETDAHMHWLVCEAASPYV